MPKSSDSDSWWGDMPWVGRILKEEKEPIEKTSTGLEISAIKEVRKKLQSLEEEAKRALEEATKLNLERIRREIEEAPSAGSSLHDKERDLLNFLKGMEGLDRAPLQRVIEKWRSELSSIEEELRKGKVSRTELEKSITVMSKKIEICARMLQK